MPETSSLLFFVPQGRVAEKGGEGDGVVVGRGLSLLCPVMAIPIGEHVCVRVRERGRVCINMCVRVCIYASESLHLCVCVGESKSLHVYMSACMFINA